MECGINANGLDERHEEYLIKYSAVLLRQRAVETPCRCGSGGGLYRQFAAADTIVIAAPFWDLSFPAMLKQYFEQISAIGITFKYSEEGYPVGLCKAKKLYYVTTAGGMFFPEEYGFGYIRALAENFYGIKECIMFKAIGLDIDGADEEQILLECEKQIREEV